jgi:predicted DNA-binding protein
MKNTQKQTTIYFDPDLYHDLRIKAAETGRSVSELVNQAVRPFLAEDAEDISAFAQREHEPNLPFEDVLKDLRRRKKI